jgi:hypothetical protein
MLKNNVTKKKNDKASLKENVSACVITHVDRFSSENTTTKRTAVKIRCDIQKTFSKNSSNAKFRLQNRKTEENRKRSLDKPIDLEKARTLYHKLNSDLRKEEAGVEFLNFFCKKESQRLQSGQEADSKMAQNPISEYPFDTLSYQLQKEIFSKTSQLRILQGKLGDAKASKKFFVFMETTTLRTALIEECERLEDMNDRFQSAFLALSTSENQAKLSKARLGKCEISESEYKILEMETDILKSEKFVKDFHMKSTKLNEEEFQLLNDIEEIHIELNKTDVELEFFRAQLNSFSM